MFEPSNPQPILVGTFNQLEYERQDDVLGDTASGLIGSEAHGIKGGLNWVGGATMCPMLSGEVKERQQDIEEFFVTFIGDPDDHQHALPLIGPDIDIALLP